MMSKKKEQVPQILYANTVPLEEWPSTIEHVVEPQLVDAAGEDRFFVAGNQLPLVEPHLDERLMRDRTYRKITLATNHPNSGTPSTPISVRRGEAFYWATSSGTWRAGTSHPMTGPEGNTDRPANSRFYCSLETTHVGTMVSKSRHAGGTQYWVYYQPILDRSRGGTYIYRNNTLEDWILHFFFNDDLRYYGDNYGRIEHEIVVRE